MLLEKQSELGIYVPQELRSLYMFSYAPILGDYKVLTLREIASLMVDLHSIYEGLWNPSFIPFAYVMGVGDYLVLEQGEERAGGLLVRDGFHELPPHQWEGICYGLREWLLRMTASHFEPFWFTQK